MRKDLVGIGAILWLVLCPMSVILGFNSGVIALAAMGYIFGFAGFFIFIAGLVMGEKSIAPPPPAFNAGPSFHSPMNSYNPGGMPPPPVQPRGYNAPMNQNMPNYQQNQYQNQMNTNQTTMQSNNADNDPVKQIEKWGQLMEKGLITKEEFQRKKDELLR